VSVFGTLDPAPPLDNKIDNAAGLDEVVIFFFSINVLYSSNENINTLIIKS
jgi:hypothetical protein